jgi:transposase
MVVADGKGLPVGGTLSSASPTEVTLVIPGLAGRCLIVCRAYDADSLRHLMRHLEGKLICPHRRNRKRASLQDGRAVRRYKHRSKVERLFAWIGVWRRLLVRHERRIDLYSGFFKLA